MTRIDGGHEEESARLGTVCLLFVIALALFCVGVVRGSTLAFEDGMIRPGMNEPVTASIYVFAFGLLLAVLRAPARRTDTEAGDVPLCAHCIRPYRIGVHFCTRCSSPLTVFAATADYEGAHAQAWIFGKALKQPRRLLHVAGVAMFCLPPLLLVPVLLVGNSVYDEFYSPDPANLAFTGAGCLVYALVMLYCWRNWQRFRRDPESAPRASEYGAPPWWTYDRWWTLPEDDAEEEAGPDADGADSPSEAPS